MDADTRQFVFIRALDRCEYCRLPQSAAPYFTFHVEHIEAQQHITDDSLDNLALADSDAVDRANTQMPRIRGTTMAIHFKSDGKRLSFIQALRKPSCEKRLQSSCPKR